MTTSAAFVFVAATFRWPSVFFRQLAAATSGAAT
jgi:hypothetical protein